MLDFAYGELNLLPDVFWNLSWGEYYRMVRGYHRRIELQNKLVASIRADINNTIPRSKSHPKGNQPYTADDFLSKETDTDQQDMTLEERQKLAQEALERSKRFDGRGVVKTEV